MRMAAAMRATAFVLAAATQLALPVQAQTRGPILAPSPTSRAPVTRPAPPTELRPTLDGREREDPHDSQLREVPRDGVLAEPAETLPRDGIIEVPEPEAPAPGGIDTTRLDGRSGADFEAVELPPAGHDPQLFQIEDIEPRSDRRVGAFFAAEPYAPVGYRIGRFVVFPQLELAGVAFSNVLRSTAGTRSDVALDMRPELRVVSNWRRHAVELKANGAFTFHEQLPGEDDRESLLEARGRADFSRRTNLQGLVSREVRQEGRSGVDANRLGERADVTTTQAAASLNHRINRLALQLRGGIADTTYGTTQDETTGAVIERRDRNVVQTDQGFRLRYDRRSQVGVFADVALVQREYGLAPDDGLRRDSTGERYRIGLDFLPSHPRLRGEVSLGWGTQRHDERALVSADGLLFDASLAWRMTPLTSLLLSARSDIVDSTNAGVGGVVTRTYGLDVRHGLRRYLTGTAGVQLATNSYRGVSLDERETTARLGLEYAISREVQLFSRYDHIWFDSSAAASNWQADEVRLGLRLRH